MKLIINMEYSKLTTVLLALVLFSACNQHGNAGASKEKEQETARTSDVIDLIGDLHNKVKELYKCNETNSSQVDFEPLLLKEADSVYAGLDLERHKMRINELRETNLFTDQFISNYDKIGLIIDKKLRDKSWVWNVGELPPFGNGANPWCNCQDNPDNFWEKIILKDANFANNLATFNWSWGDGFNYKAKAVLANGIWKIDYLEGFDPKVFLPNTQID